MKPRDAIVAAPFIPAGGMVGADSRTHSHSAKVSDRSVKVPSFSKWRVGCPEVTTATAAGSDLCTLRRLRLCWRNLLQLHPIDYPGRRRKPFAEIEKEINQIKRQMEAYRVAAIKYVVAGACHVICSCANA